jgi:hypothetical protein
MAPLLITSLYNNIDAAPYASHEARNFRLRSRPAPHENFHRLLQLRQVTNVCNSEVGDVSKRRGRGEYENHGGRRKSEERQDRRKGRGQRTVIGSSALLVCIW